MHWNRGVEVAVSLMNGNGSVLALFCFLLLTKLAHTGEKNTKLAHSGEKSKEHQTLHSAQTRRALQLGARLALWSILDTGGFGAH